jgi:lipopolysaccharide assembly outer membrane protein LptD (OstA)
MGATEGGSMKTGPALALCLALLPLTAQNNSDIKRLTVSSVVSGPPVQLAAKSLEQNAGIVYLKGSVEINLGTYALLADEAEYYQDGGEIQTHGDVRLKPMPVMAPRRLNQFGVK